MQKQLSGLSVLIMTMSASTTERCRLPRLNDFIIWDGEFIHILKFDVQEGRPLAVAKKREYIRKMLPPGAFSLICYCLMPNHFHFLIRQNTNLPVSKLVSKLCTGYSMVYNKKYKKTGNLLQSKFRAIRVDTDTYLLWLSAYIHNNPKTAGLVDDLQDYQFSSYLDYVGQRKGKLCDQSLILEMFKNDRQVYKKFVSESFDIIKKKKDLELLLLD
jgi:putative transposase